MRFKDTPDFYQPELHKPCNFDVFAKLWRADTARAGTKDFQGLGNFHNTDYKWFLRSAAHYADYKGLKSVPCQRWWQRKYLQLHNTLLEAGLDPAGSGVEHDQIIFEILGVQ